MGSVANAPSPFMSQPQNSVDMLGELPDIDFFSIPGDRSVSMEHSLCYFCSCSHGGNIPRVLSCSTICLFWSAVEDFYEDYVTELGSRNSRKLSGEVSVELKQLASTCAAVLKAARQSVDNRLEAKLIHGEAAPCVCQHAWFD